MDPVTAAALAAQEIARAIRADLELDLFLAQEDEEYRKVLIEERVARKQFWQPLIDLFSNITFPSEVEE